MTDMFSVRKEAFINRTDARFKKTFNFHQVPRLTSDDVSTIGKYLASQVDASSDNERNPNVEYVCKLQQLIELAMMGTFDIGSSKNVMNTFFRDIQMASDFHPEVNGQIIRCAGEGWDECFR